MSSARHPSVDDVAWVFFDFTFLRRFLLAKGTTFQNLFGSIMQKAHGADFCLSGPWGASGDLKCDGYLTTQRMVFAAYAPKDFAKLSKATRKIVGDHAGARKHWSTLMDRWTLVHNEMDGLPAPLLKVLLLLAAKYPAPIVAHWGCEELRALLRPLTRDQLTDLFGKAPDRRSLSGVSQQDLKQVIDDLAATIESFQSPATEDLRAVPATKLAYNKLSNAVREFLALGRRHASKVDAFFEKHPDPELAARVVEGFKSRYVQLRQAAMTPDEIFSSLYEYAGGFDAAPRRALAAVAVLAYLFEACHIFERPATATGAPAS
jgi:hypothetical protein